MAGGAGCRAAGEGAGNVFGGCDPGEVQDMNRQHYGAIAAVLIGFIVCRVLSYHVVDAFGSLGGHTRPGDSVVGAVLGAVPFAALAIYAGLLLGGIDVLHRRWIKVLATVGWLFAGAVMGVLPYSRFGTETDLVQKERSTAPGFLHALDVTIFVGLVVVVALLLISLRAHPRDRTLR
jgi:hypothetical protein